MFHSRGTIQLNGFAPPLRGSRSIFAPFPGLRPSLRLVLHPGLLSFAPSGSSCRYAVSNSKVLTRTLRPGVGFVAFAARLNRLLKNSEHKTQRNETVPQGLKAVIDLMNLMYGLKSVPFKTGLKSVPFKTRLKSVPFKARSSPTFFSSH
jgi:hypothetical protein